MDAYRHITPIERGCIMTLFNQGHSPAAIATMLKRHRCTILRELKRNSDGESYDASKAQEKYDSRRKLYTFFPDKLVKPGIFPVCFWHINGLQIGQCFFNGRRI